MTEETKLKALEILAKSGMNPRQFIMENSGNLTIYNNGEEKEAAEQKDTGEQKESRQDADVIAKALKKCASFVWGNAAYAVAFCVCRDMCGWQDNASYFERQMQQQGIVFPPGTINTTMSRNPFMKLNVDKWDGNGVMERVIKLRDEFQQQVVFAEQCKQKA